MTARMNHIKPFFSFIRKEFYHIWRDKQTLLILFGMPIVQIIIFGFALTNEVKNSGIAVLDPSRDASTVQITARLEASQYFDILEDLVTDKAIDRAFKEGRIKMALVFPPDFRNTLMRTGHADVQIITDASDPNIASTVANYASAIIRDYQMEQWGLSRIPFRINTTMRMLYNPQLKGAYNFVPGVMAMILLLVCTMMTSIAIVREKERGTMEILLASPLKPSMVIIAKAVPYLVLSFVNIISILLLSVFVLDLPIAGSLPLLLAESVLFTITALALGLLISSITNSQLVAMLISLVGMFLPTLMFSGFMFPVENMPVPLQVISNIIPAKWYY